jgi:drug/metabolite transporter (DMT)-like permease
MSSTNTALKPTPIHWAVLIALSIIWGFSFILIKRALVSFSPMQVAELRMGMSGTIFLPYFLYRFKHIDWSRLKYFLIVGFCGSGLPAICFAMAQQHISSSVAGILNSLAPLFTLLFGILLFKQAYVPSRLIGVILGFVGAFMLMLLKSGSAQDGNQWYGILCVIGTMMYGINSNTVGRFFKGVNPIDISAVSYVIVGLPFAALLFLTTDFVSVMQTKPEAWTSLGYMTILAVVGTVIANAIFISLIQKTSALFGAMVTYLMPFMAIFIGFLDHENIGIYHFLSMATILVGVYITNRK